ncbi:MAG: hypothetical protein IPK85_01645 [Gemmatimonadetes bacterium]|jgi:hypothetical protein|nr:hypothetical protein [Gemmatimonadota bacterium]
MTKLAAPANAKSASIRVTVIRADGRVEDHGVVAFYHRNPLYRWAYRVRRAIRRILPWRQS